MTGEQVKDTLGHVLKKYGIRWPQRMPLPIQIPNAGRDDLPGLFAELGFTSGVEVGVWKGEFSEKLCQANLALQLYGVDPWDARAFPAFILGWSKDQRDFENFYEQTLARMEKHKFTPVRKYSAEAVKLFSDGSLDFVYIDGNHDFENTTIDICRWSHKVRPGGIVAGHDYAKFSPKHDIHVWYVVNAYTAAYDIRPWFVLGAQERLPDSGIKRDKYRSWFWIKPDDTL